MDASLRPLTPLPVWRCHVVPPLAMKQLAASTPLRGQDDMGQACLCVSRTRTAAMAARKTTIAKFCKDVGLLAPRETELATAVNVVVKGTDVGGLQDTRHFTASYIKRSVAGDRI